MIKKAFILTLTLITLVFKSEAQDFTIGTIPDSQNLTEKDSLAGRLTEMTEWYAKHKDSLNLKFVAALGDMTQWGAPDQWERVKKSYSVLKNAGIPYAPCQGNHEPDLALFDKVFPVSDFEKMPTFGGYFEGMHNAFYLLTEAGVDYIIVVIQTHDQFIKTYDVNSINWANTIIDKYATRKAILITHDFFENKKLVSDIIKKHDNLILAICGHSCARERYWTEQSPSGNKIHCIMTDYQCDADKGATLRYYRFKPSENKVFAYTYSITKRKYEVIGSSQFSFKAQISVANEPEILKVLSTPTSPKSGDSVKISAIITDNSSNISAVLNWGNISGNMKNSVKMNSNGNEFFSNIPVSTGQIIYYSIMATDKDNNISTSKEYSYANEEAAASNKRNEYLLQSILWYQQSGEMQALYYQAYNFAKQMLDVNLKTANSSKKKAVVVDIDETLLNNSPLFGKCIKTDSICDGNQWVQWINKATADTLPGALDFLNYAKSKGVEIIYISNRGVTDVAATLVNLRRFNFPDADEKHLLFRESDSGSKEIRRQKVAQTYDIVMLCGDNLGDFSVAFENRDFKAISDSVKNNRSKFGKKFIVLPNPFYGSWEHTVYGNTPNNEVQRENVRRSKVIGY
jgi:5'-nucleotidase (lipoprotein e(P4) family)